MWEVFGSDRCWADTVLHSRSFPGRSDSDVPAVLVAVVPAPRLACFVRLYLAQCWPKTGPPVGQMLHKYDPNCLCPDWTPKLGPYLVQSWPKKEPVATDRPIAARIRPVCSQKRPILGQGQTETPHVTGYRQDLWILSVSAALVTEIATMAYHRGRGTCRS